MISSIVKKICVMSLMAVLCVVQVEARKASKDNEELRKIPFGGAGCDAEFDRFKDCIEGIIARKLAKIEHELEREFCDRNEFIFNKLESLNIHLKEFIACQQKANDMSLEDFFACNLDKTETSVEEFIVHRIDCILALLCQKLENLDGDIDQVICKIEIGDGSIICINDLLIGFLGVLNGIPPYAGLFTDLCLSTPDSIINPCSEVSCADCSDGTCTIC